jgi:hypothetical protein
VEAIARSRPTPDLCLPLSALPIVGTCIGIRQYLGGTSPRWRSGQGRYPVWMPAFAARLEWIPECRIIDRDMMPMIRVTKTEEPSRTVVAVDGQLSGESTTAVETCCSQAESSRKPVCLFLRDVTTVDQAGTILLRRLAAKGIRLLASGVSTSYLVQTLDSGDAAALASSARTEHLDPAATRRTL